MPTARLFPLLWLILVTGRPSFAIDPYPRECYQATIPPGSHDAQGVATIVDERTIRVEHFTYDGGAPLVYFYLGAENTSSAFTNGIPIGPELDRAYHDEGITVQLPAGETLDGWNAISVWCAEFKVNFSSASFIEPTYARACQKAVLAPGSHDAQGVATIVDERTIRVDHFTYDGLAPAVYFYLGRTNTYSDFFNGIPIGPLLTRAYSDETISVELPQGETLDGHGAISVWCETAKANFTSAAFPRATPDFDINGLVDAADLMHFESCHTGPSVGPPAAGCEEADLDGDGDVDGRDFGKLQRCLSFDTPALPDCAE